MTSRQTTSDRRGGAWSHPRWAGLPATRHRLRRGLAGAASATVFSVAVALLVWSCEGSPTSSGGGTTGSGGGGGGNGGPPPGYTPVNVGEPVQGTLTGSDPVCTSSAYYYVGGPCQKFAIAGTGKAGTLTVQLAWDEPANQLALSDAYAVGWAECCQSPLKHQVQLAAGTSWDLVQVMLIGPKDPTGTVGQGTSQKFTLTTEFSPQ